jgi:hypothetical protein
MVKDLRGKPVCVRDKQNGSTTSMIRFGMIRFGMTRFGMTRFGLSIVAVRAISAAVLFGVTPGRAGTFGNAPWCAVIPMGDGDVHWDCEYNSVQACQPNVIAGNRGFCNVNPYWSPTTPADARTTPRRQRPYRY